MAINRELFERMREEREMSGQSSSLPTTPSLGSERRPEDAVPPSPVRMPSPRLPTSSKEGLTGYGSAESLGFRKKVPLAPTIAKAVGEATFGPALNLMQLYRERDLPEEQKGQDVKVAGMDVRAPDTVREFVGDIGTIALDVALTVMTAGGSALWKARKGVKIADKTLENAKKIRLAREAEISREAAKSKSYADSLESAGKTASKLEDAKNLGTAEEALVEAGKITSKAPGLIASEVAENIPTKIKMGSRATKFGKTIVNWGAAGSAYGFFGGMQEDLTFGEALKSGVIGGVLGASMPIGLKLTKYGVKAVGKAVKETGKLGASAVLKTFEKVTGRDLVKSFYDTEVYKKVIGDTMTVLSKMGVNGKAASALLRYSEFKAETKAARATGEVLEALGKLSRNELKGFRQIVEGGFVPHGGSSSGAVKVEGLSDDFIRAVQKWREHAKAIAVEAKELGIELHDLDGNKYPFMERPNYFPHIINAEYALSKDGYNRMLGAMVKNGDAVNVADAENKFLKFIMRNRERKAGSLEHLRTEMLPEEFYIQDPREVVVRYFRDSHRRLSQIRILGNRDERINALISKMGDGSDATTIGDRKLARQIVDRVLGKEGKGDFADISRKLRAYNTFTKLGLFAITNSTQSVNTATMAGTKNLIAGMRKFFTKEGINFANKSAAILDTTVQDMLNEVAARGIEKELAGLNPLQRAKKIQTFLKDANLDSWMRKFFKWSGGNATEKFNRGVAANASRYYVLEMQQRLFKNPLDNDAARRLTEMGIRIGASDPTSIFNKPIKNIYDKRLQIAGNRLARATQFRTAPSDMPLFWSSDQGRILTQFKSFAYQHAKFIKNQVLKEAANGNFKPLIRFAVLGVAAGEVSSDVKAIARGDTKRWKKSGMERVIDNITAVGGIGIMGDALRSSFSGLLGATFFVGGPSLSLGGEALSSAGGLFTGNEEQTGRFLLKQIPFIGPFLQAKALPTKSQR
jgi:hypothetical protein